VPNFRVMLDMTVMDVADAVEAAKVARTIIRDGEATADFLVTDLDTGDEVEVELVAEQDERGEEDEFDE